MKKTATRAAALLLAILLAASLIINQNFLLRSSAEDEDDDYVTADITEEDSQAEEDSRAEENFASETGEFALTEQTLTAEVNGISTYGVGSSVDTAITLSGMLPEGARVSAEPVNVSMEGVTVLAAYDITIYDADGAAYEPEDGAIRVSFQSGAISDAIADSASLAVYHMEDLSADPEEVAVAGSSGSTVSFDAESFSIYIVVENDDGNEQLYETDGETPHYVYTVNFYVEDKTGQPVSTQTVSPGEHVEIPGVPEVEQSIFVGWYTQPNGEGELCDFSDSNTLPAITDNQDHEIDLYAHWTEANVAYTINIWRQKAIDGDEGLSSKEIQSGETYQDYIGYYDYAESHYVSAEDSKLKTGDTPTTGTVDSWSTYTGYATTTDEDSAYYGFEYGTNTTAETRTLNELATVTMTADGSTIINIYYNRVTITWTYKNNSSAAVRYMLTGLYGTAVDWPTSDSEYWSYNSSTYTFETQFKILNNSTSVTFTRSSFNERANGYYYLEVTNKATQVDENGDKATEAQGYGVSYTKTVDGVDYVYDQRIQIWPKEFTIGEKYNGYTYVGYNTSNSGTSIAYKSDTISSPTNGGSYYFFNNAITTNTITLISSDKVVGVNSAGEAVTTTADTTYAATKYGAAMSDYPFPETLDGTTWGPAYYYHFTDWYEDPTLTAKFSTMTMPNNNVVAYAGWKADEESGYTMQYNLNVNNAYGLLDGYTGSTTSENDEHFTADEELWTIETAFPGLTDDVYGMFIGWNTAADGTGKMYYPDELFSLENVTVDNEGRVTLYAIWAHKNESTLILVHNYPTGYTPSEGETQEDIVVTGDNLTAINLTETTGLEYHQEITVTDFDGTVQTYRFEGWSTTLTTADSATGADVDVDAGATVAVDTLNTNTETNANYLYAVWLEVHGITVTKVWDDADNRDGKRPASVTVQLCTVDGETVTPIDGKTLTLSEENNWQGSFTELDENENGKAIVYTVTEKEVDGYTTEITGDASTGYIITNTNTHTPETIDIDVEKAWDDNNDQDGIRPNSVTVTLLADNEETEQILTLNEGNNWRGSFTNLDKYANGQEITYSVSEAAVEGYTTSTVSGTRVDGTAAYTITNTHTPETIKITVNKVWDDNDDQDGIRPGSVTINLLADNETVNTATLGEQTIGPLSKLISFLRADGDEDEWSTTFESLPKYSNGKEIEYTITETAVNGYTTEITGSVTDGFIVTNTHTPATVNLTVTKEWDDADNQDGIRPNSVTVTLLADNEETEQTLTLNDSNNWSGSFTNLDKYANGQEITYTVSEDTITVAEGHTTGYTATIGTLTAVEGEDDAYTVTITNSHTPEVIDISGTKTWDDNDNQDGKRPASITVNLLADGVKIEEDKVEAEHTGLFARIAAFFTGTTVTASDNWTFSFNDLPKYSDGTEIIYTVTEDAVDNYSTAYDGYNITNTYTPSQISVTVTKIWDDDNNRDGIRPTSVTVTLLADNEETEQTLTLTAADNWTGSFTELDEYENGQKITYTVQETDFTDANGKSDTYTSDITGDAENGFTITNTHVPETTEVTITKSWDDNENQDGIRPTEITVNLLANGDVVATQAIGAVDNWTYTFTDLPKNDDGKEITYTVTETAIDGYTAAYGGTVVDGLTITNTHTPETITISGSKTWEDNDDEDGYRPTSVTINLLANGTAVDGATVTESDSWTYSFTDLPKYDSGSEITYTVTEDAVDHYSAEYNGYDITNTHTPDQTSVTVVKVWDDADNQDGIRPDSVTVSLLADGSATGQTLTLNESNNWRDTFTELDMYHEHGTAIKYTVKETDLDSEYEEKNYDLSVTGSAETGYIIVNSHEPETVNLTVTKEWDDADNRDGLRPESVTVQLYTGEGENAQAVEGKTLTLNEGNNWTGSFTELDEYAGGQKITYTVQETGFADKNNDSTTYTAEVSGDMTSGYTITNTHTPETIDIDVEKVWDDNDDQDGIRPDYITVHLLADNETVDTATLGEQTTGSLSRLISFLRADDNEDEWSTSFTDLPKYSNGKEITYTITETAADGYDTAITGDAATGFSIINSYTPSKTSVTVTKIWDDDNNRDGLRPDSVTVQLYTVENEELTEVEGETLTLTATDSWTGSFTELDEYENGQKITYTVQETDFADASGNSDTYTTEITGNMEEGFSIINSHIPETVDVDGSKTWDDKNNQDGARPESITVRLWNGSTMLNSVEVTKDDNWSWSFTDLPKYENGEEIVYNVTEDIVPDYSTTYSEEGYDVTNTHTPEQTSVTVMKVWDDAGDQDGLRPDKITVTLLADGEETGETLTLDESNNWLSSFTDLNMYKDGEEIEYTVAELAVDDYESVITGDMTSGYVITNTHEPALVNETGELTVTKVWNDNNNANGLRPVSVTVNLLANGDVVATQAIGAVDNWTYTFTDLPKNDDGKEITYTVTETAIDGYTAAYGGTVVDGLTITNTHTPETITISGSKTWVDNDDEDGYRPKSITINLLANGTAVDSATVTGDDWTYSFTDLPKYDSGSEITYTVTEDAVEHYSAEYDGYDITNTHTPDQTSVTVVKVWDDADNQDGIRPDEVTVQLYADDELVEGATLTLNESNNWRDTFTELDMYHDHGEKIEYTVTETAVEGYDTKITSNNATGAYIITNTHTPATVNLTVTKEWEDANNQDGIRPNEVTVTLVKDGAETDQTLTLDETNNWSGSFENLAKYASGTEIKYSVSENAIVLPEGHEGETGYTTSITGDAPDGFTITNSHTPATIDITGTKVWDDNDDQDGKRPESITVNLLADGLEIEEDELEAEPTGLFARIAAFFTGKTVTASDNWTFSFNDLPKYSNGTEIQYTVTEDAVTDYSTEITGSASEGYTITNSYTPEQTSVTVTKFWDDADNRDGLRPESVTVQLCTVDGETVTPIDGKTLTLSEENSWQGSFTELDEYENGKKITYTVQETDFVDANGETDTYTAKVTGNMTEGYTITNKHTPQTVDITVTKAWKDAENQDGIRPDSVTVNLLANEKAVDSAAIRAVDDWTYTFEGLPKNEYNSTTGSSTAIEYTVTEDAIAAEEGHTTGYTATIGTLTAVEGEDDAYTVTITNTHVPETITISGSKTWVDNDDEDGYRPKSITINLLANGTAVDSATVTGDDWTYSFTDLPKYDSGSEIIYTVTENAVDHYSVEYDGYDITNTHTPDQTSVTVVKVWDDADNQDGIRPTSVTITLLADGEETEQTLTLDESNNWRDTFTGLDMNHDHGTAIKYTVKETSVASGYTETEQEITGSAETGYIIVNSHEPETVNLTVTKEWEDANNQDGIRPTEITVYLESDGRLVYDGNNGLVSATLNANNNWTAEFKDLALNEGLDSEGKVQKVAYTVVEASVDGYDSDIGTLTTESDGSCSITITNTHTPETIDIDVEKVWDDNDDQDGIRPGSVTINLLADNETVDTATLGEQTTGPLSRLISFLRADDNEDEWSTSFTDLPKYSNGKEITYTITETAVTGYETVITGSVTDGFIVTNSHTPETIDITVNKVWDDKDDQDGIRPTSVTVTLLADNEETEQTLTLTAADNWTVSFTELDKYDSGEEIKYSVSENAIVLPEGHEGETGYTTSITGDAATGYTITNSHTPETIDIEGSKTWDDSEDQDGARPTSITINLYADGEPAVDENEQPVTAAVTASDSWSWSFTDLPKYKSGTEIAYTITEGAVDDYETKIDGYDVTNTHAPGKVSVNVQKIWDDADDQDGLRPDDVTVTLVKNSVSTDQTITLNESNSWSGAFADLDEYTDGVKNTYTVAEETVTGYESKIEPVTGTSTINITNTHEPALVNEDGTITVTKSWDDADNRDGIRPTEITVNLLADGDAALDENNEAITATVTASDNWIAAFEDLPKYADGEEITYTVTETAIDGYTAAYGGTVVGGLTITNTHEPELLNGDDEDPNNDGVITVTKVWDDANDQDGIRPTEITINLLADGDAVKDAALTLSKENSWTGSFTGLEKYRDGGVEIEYTVEEIAVDGYDTTINGYVITNSHIPETLEVEGSKTWDDNDDQDGARPESITVHLWNGNTMVDSVKVTESDGWSWSFTDLPKYADGTEIVYNVTEDIVPDYSTTYSEEGYDITNTHTPKQTSVSVMKAWDDAGDQDGLRPKSITVTLLADGEETDQTLTLDESNNWLGSFTDLDVYKDGEKIEYTVSELEIDDYESVITGDATIGYVITNTHTPELLNEPDNPDTPDVPKVEPGELPVTKVWIDNDDALNLRPSEVTVALLANGKPTGETLVLSEENDWSAAFTGLHRYAGGEAVTYTVEETDAPAYYTATSNAVQGSGSVTLTNELGLAFFPMDEEIVPDNDDEANPDSWLSKESVNEYDAIEIEMSTTLPLVDGETLAAGDYNMTFHNQLVSQLVLDDLETDFTVDINGQTIDSQYFEIDVAPAVAPLSLVRVAEISDGCSFHVSVDLSALYLDGVITDDDLGEGTVRVFFYADLETVDVNGSYTSTAWYDLTAGDDVLYTSEQSVVTLYTFEIVIDKVDDTTGEALPGATFGLYYDEDCTDAVSRNGEDYVVTSDEDGQAMFVGIAAGSYYVKELAAPDGYDLSDEIAAVTLVDAEDDEHIIEITYVNTLTRAELPDEPVIPGEPTEPEAPIEPTEPDEHDVPDEITESEDNEDNKDDGKVAADGNNSDGKSGGSGGESVETAAAPKTSDSSKPYLAMTLMLFCVAAAMILLVSLKRKPHVTGKRCK